MQMAERHKAHLDRNMARKLNHTEISEKKDRKLFDKNSELYVAIYRISQSIHPQNSFKININAVENKLSGVCLITDKITVVIVEGCRKSQDRYFKLMNRRIKWNMYKMDETKSFSEEHTKCDLLWFGSVKVRSFGKFTVYRNLSDRSAKKYYRT